MPLEAAIWITDLVPTNPVGASDTKSQGDDHIRQIKTVLQTNFPNATKAFYFPFGLAKTATYTILAADENKNITADATAGAFTLTLPTLPASRDGWRCSVTKIDSNSNRVTIAGTINGLTNYILMKQFESVQLIWTGTQWIAGASENIRLNFTSKSADATLIRAEMFGYLQVNTSGGGVVITPPTAPLLGDWVWIKKVAAANNVTINPSGATTIDGAGTFLMTQDQEAILIMWDNTEWKILSHKITVTVPTLVYPASHVANLKIIPGSVPASRIDITFDVAALISNAGVTVQHLSGVLTLNLATTGANGLDTGTVANNTMYYVWLISNGTTLACIARANNNNNPVAPAGYIYRKLIGWVRTGAAAALYQSNQIGNRFQYIFGGATLPGTGIILDSGIKGTYSSTGPTLVNASWSTFAPIEASTLRIGIRNPAGGIMVAPSTAYGGANNGPAGTNNMQYPLWTESIGSWVADILPESTNIAWASSDASARLFLQGFTVPWV